MDEALLRVINGWAAAPWVASVGVFLSSGWLVLLVCGPLGLWLARKKRFWAIASVALAMGAADAVTARVVKPVVARERPCRTLEGLVQPASCGVGKSFPSGHAAVSFAFLVSAAPAVRWGWALLAPIAFLVSGSRVLLGVHYPSDVAAGGFLGALIGLGAFLARRAIEARRQKS